LRGISAPLEVAIEKNTTAASRPWSLATRWRPPWQCGHESWPTTRGSGGRDTIADDLVFPGEEGGFLDASALRRRYYVAFDVAGLERMRFHDSLAINSASLVQVRHWPGHADLKTTAPTTCIPSRRDDPQLLASAFRPEEARDDLELGWSREDAVSAGAR
jgi:hypothetical protein